MLHSPNLGSTASRTTTKMVWGVLAIALMGAPEIAHAHDFWIQPSSFTAVPGQRIKVHLFTGHDSKRDEYIRKPDRIIRFDLHSPSGAVKISGKPGQTPAGSVQLTGAGIHTLVYQSTHARIELPAPRFESYLAEEGLQTIIADRARRGESKQAGRERYARYCKSLVRVGNANTGFDRKIGLPFEITALTNPFAARVGAPLSFVVEFQGAPLANAYVELVNLDEVRPTLSARTDKRGRVQLALPASGTWMVAVVHMHRIPKQTAPKAQRKPKSGAKSGAADDKPDHWESYWATLTFATGS